MTRPMKVSIIGAGMAGQAHAFGYRNSSMEGTGDLRVELEAIADPNLPLAQSVAQRYGFARATDDIDAVLDSQADIISVALPNYVHTDVLPRALATHKHVFAEKPLGRNGRESRELYDLSLRCRGLTGVGFSFRRLPGLAAIADLASSGDLGEIYTVDAWYYADYGADPLAPLSWRYDASRAGPGALLDIGAHAIDALQYVAGPITEVLSAHLRTVIPSRPLPQSGAIGHTRAASRGYGSVTNDDIAQLTVGFHSDATGSLALSRVAHGTPNSLGVTIRGSQGYATFDSISATEFHVFTREAAPPSHNGPRRVFTGPQHPYFADVAPMPGAGVGTGYGEAFLAEIQHFLRCIIDQRPMDTTFLTALNMMNVVDSAVQSHRDGTPVGVPEVAGD